MAEPTKNRGTQTVGWLRAVVLSPNDDIVRPTVNCWTGQAPRFASGHDASVAGVQGEIDHVAIYDRLLRATQRSDLLDVFRALCSVSQERHPGAFQRGAQRG